VESGGRTRTSQHAARGAWSSAAGRLVPRSLGRAFGALGLPIATLALIGIFAALSPVFLTTSNWNNIVENAALPAVVAVGLTVCLVMNDYDLSIGATSSFATMFVSVLVASDAKPLLLGILFAMGVGVLIGMTNGLFVAYVGLSALVVTIAIGSVLNGAEFLVSGNNQIYGGYPQGFVEFTRSETIHIPNLVFVALCIAIVFWLMLERTALGRNMRAVGGNSEAARLAGVNVRRTRAIGFVLCASAATLAGTLYAGKQAVAYPLAGLNVLLPSYAAAFLGAAMFKLGQFNIWGTVVGVMIAEIVANGLLLLSVPSYGTYIFQGAILVAALTFARIVGRRQAA
jgi:ribose transport system permease protein